MIAKFLLFVMIITLEIIPTLCLMRYLDKNRENLTPNTLAMAIVSEISIATTVISLAIYCFGD